MSSFTIFNETTGEARITIHANLDVTSENVQTGEIAVVGDYPKMTHYHNGLGVVAYTDPQKAAKAAIPTSASTWDNITMAWIAD